MKTIKKTFLALVVTLTFLGCSKNDDDTPKELAVNYQNMAGNWDLSSIIQANGNVVSYQGLCTTKRDFFKITLQYDITEEHYSPNCSSIGNSIDSDGYFIEGILIKNANGVFTDAKITSLTANTMKIEYDQQKSYGYFSTYEQVKGAILTR